MNIRTIQLGASLIACWWLVTASVLHAVSPQVLQTCYIQTYTVGRKPRFNNLTCLQCQRNKAAAGNSPATELQGSSEKVEGSVGRFEGIAIELQGTARETEHNAVLLTDDQPQHVASGQEIAQLSAALAGLQSAAFPGDCSYQRSNTPSLSVM